MSAAQILLPAEMQEAERRAFATGVSAEQLMEVAGRGVAEVVQQFYPRPGTCLVVFGKGHNGADALVAARHLASAGWKMLLLAAFPMEDWSALTHRKFEEAQPCDTFVNSGSAWEETLLSRRWSAGPLVVLDGLLGVGASGPLRDPLAPLAARMNALRDTAYAQVIAIDLPTGLDGGTGEAAPGCVVADVTVTLGFAKRGLLEDQASNFVGRLALVPLPQLDPHAPARASEGMLAEPGVLAGLLARRLFEAHKGLFGRISIVAGSRGFTGAALLCSAACVHAGAGLVSLFVPEDVYPIVAAGAVKEVMVHPVRSYTEVLETKCDVLALGPGLGRSRGQEIVELIRQGTQPMVIDADGLNILSEKMELLHLPAGPRLLTPHPGEMARLDPASKGLSRRETATRFVERCPVTLLLKGARTLVAEQGQPLSYNTTGHPGMATGGMGDVLTGVCAALLGQRLNCYDAARLGAWLCGHAAELALSEERESQESLTPSNLLRHLGPAFRDLHLRGY